MADKPTTFYIFYGDDGVSLDQALAKLRAGMLEDPNGELNMSEFEGEQTSVHEVINAVSSFPFLASNRMVIVKGLISWITRKGAGQTGKKELELLLESLPNLPEYSKLVLVEHGTLPENNPVVQMAKKEAAGYAGSFSTPKGQDLERWIARRAKEAYGTEIEPQAVHALAELTIEDIRRADNELVKLASYVGGERAITIDDVILLTPYPPQANIFNMVDWMVEGKGDKALREMHQVLNEDTSDPGFRMLATITGHFRLLLLAREHLSGGGSSQGKDIADAIGVRSTWRAEKLSRQSRAFSVEQLEKIYRQLQEYDYKIKTGQIPIKLALDMFVTVLSRER